jgi:tetratricopeptide (TPR) repeat protein
MASPLRRLADAEHDLDHALMLDPHFAAARLNRGAVRMFRGQIAEAKADFTKVIQEHPHNLQAKYYLALAEFKSRNWPDALAKCNDLLSARAKLRPARMLRTCIHLEQDNAERARADLNELLRQADATLDLTGADAAARRCRLLRVLAERGSSDFRKRVRKLALDEGEAAVAGGHRSAALFDDLGAILLLEKRQEEAIGRFGEGLACEAAAPLHSALRRKRGQALVDLQEYARAKEDYAQASRLTGGDSWAQATRAEAHAMLGYIAARQGLADEALREAALSVAQIKDASNFTLWSNLACVYAVLSEAKTPDAPALQDAAMSLLAHAVSQARRTLRADDAIDNIRNDDALKSLRGRADYNELIPAPRR